MSWFEIFAWIVGVSVFCGLLTGAITVLIAMLIEVAEEDTRRFKAWLKAGKWKRRWA